MTSEVEIKYLLNEQGAAQRTIKKLQDMYTTFTHTSSALVQSCFYIETTDKTKLKAICDAVLSGDDRTKAREIIDTCGAIMFKARSVDDEVHFAIKGAKAGEDAVHATNRIELEIVMGITLDALNQRIIDQGAKLTSRWKSAREYYKINDEMTMHIETLGGYGTIAEIEIVTDKNQEQALASIRALAEKLDITEVSQKKLGNMYAQYQKNWQHYYESGEQFTDEEWAEVGS